eukprot:1170989-Prymnesium_polylepis.1
MPSRDALLPSRDASEANPRDSSRRNSFKVLRGKTLTNLVLPSSLAAGGAPAPPACDGNVTTPLLNAAEGDGAAGASTSSRVN